jgi:transposase-like protein
MRERKTVKHTVYTIEEKEEILSLYLSGKKSSEQLAREYDLDSPKRIRVWRDMKLKYGRIVDRRGKNTESGQKRGRPKSIKIEEMRKDDLIQHIRMIEDIKKATAYLKKQNPNTK